MGARKEIKQLRDALTSFDALSQEGFEEIASIARLALLAMETPNCSLDDLGTAFEAIRGKACDIVNIINAEAEKLGCNYVDKAERRRWAASTSRSDHKVQPQPRGGTS